MGWVVSKFMAITGYSNVPAVEEHVLKCPCDQPAVYRLKILCQSGESVQDALRRYGYDPYWFHKYHIS